MNRPKTLGDLEGGGHLRYHAGAAVLAHPQLVRQQHGKEFAAHQWLGAQHCVAQAQAARMAHEQAVHFGRGNGVLQVQHASEVEQGIGLVVDGSGAIDAAMRQLRHRLPAA